VTGTTTLAAGVGNDVILDVGTNDFGGAVSVTSARDATLVDANAIDLGASTISRNLAVTASGAITDSGALDVTGTTTLAAGVGNDVILDVGTNDFGGAVSVTSARDATLVDANAIVTGTTTLAAGAANDVILDVGTNDFGGAVSVTRGTNATLVDANAMQLGGSTITGTFAATASGAITDGNGSATNVTAGALRLSATGGVADATDSLETEVGTLAANVGSGGVFIDNRGDLAIGEVDGLSGVSADTGDVEIAVASSLFLNAGVVADAAGAASFGVAVGSVIGVKADNGSIKLDATADPGDITGETGVIGFGDAVDGIAATGSIALNTEIDRSAVPDRATIFKGEGRDFAPGEEADLFLIARDGNLTIGSDADADGAEKVSVPGDLLIRAGDTARLGDLAALTIDVVAGNDIEIVLRDAGTVIAKNEVDSVDDIGVDWVANNISLNRQAAAVNPKGATGSTLIFATASGAEVPNAPNGTLFRSIFEPPRELTAEDFISDTQQFVLDYAGEGNIDPGTDVSVQPVIIEEITMRTGVLGQLASISAKSRPIWESEAVRAIECSIFEDEDPELIPPDCQQYIAAAGEVVDPRLELESVQAARESYRSLFSEADEMRDVLQSAATWRRSATSSAWGTSSVTSGT
jgi:hypothetical protein